MTWIILAAIAATVVSVVALVIWLERGESRLWRDNPKRQRAVREFMDGRKWMRGDLAWHNSKLVRVAKVYPGRMLDVTDGNGFTYPIYADALMPFDDRAGRAA